MALGLLSLTILLVAGALTSRERDRWVSHTIEVIENLERFESSILAAQARIKDPAYAGSVANRNAAQDNIARAQSCLDRLVQLTEDNSGQIGRIHGLKDLTARLSQRVAAQVAVPVDNSLSDQPFTDTINEIRTSERVLLAQRQQARSTADLSFWVFTAIAIAANLLIIWWAYTASRRYLYERNESDFEIRGLNTRLNDQVSAIRVLNATLEERVADKTSELAATVTKLQATNQELERFAYVASHDMQEPLRQVASFNNLLALKYGSQLDITANRYLEYSVSGAKRLQLMLRGLLQYTVITPAAVYRSEIPVAPMVESIMRELQDEIDASGGEVDFEAEDGLSIFGDRDMMRTLALALVSNAIKFRRKDAPPSVHVAAGRTPVQWWMSVSDNGIGVDERFLPRMFEMFARFHPVGEHPGAGVGLALSKRIVDCHSGKFTVQPNPDGEGTVFTVEVPILSNNHKNSLETGRFPY